jgi:hypothetical protein
MNTAAGYVYFADAGSPLEQALATSDTFAAFARVKRTTDSGEFELIIGRPDAVEPAGAWSIGVDANDRIVAAMGGQSFDTGVQFAVGQWHEVGLSYIGTGTGGGWAYVYVDGQRKGALLPGAIGNQQVLYLGAGLGGVSRFRGQYDHVEFWDYAADDAAFVGQQCPHPAWRDTQAMARRRRRRVVCENPGTVRRGHLGRRHGRRRDQRG